VCPAGSSGANKVASNPSIKLPGGAAIEGEEGGGTGIAGSSFVEGISVAEEGVVTGVGASGVSSISSRFRSESIVFSPLLAKGEVDVGRFKKLSFSVDKFSS
jgi:hypothetical protein